MIQHITRTTGKFLNAPPLKMLLRTPFTTINKDNFPKVYQEFTQATTLDSFEHYFKDVNIESLTYIFTNSRSSPTLSLSALEKLSTYCNLSETRGLNMLIHIKVSKANYARQLHQIPEAIQEMEAALQVMMTSDMADDFQVAKLHKELAELYLMADNVKKSLTVLLEAENLSKTHQKALESLSNPNLSDLEEVWRLLATVYSMIAFANLRSMNHYNARTQLGKSMEYWKKLPANVSRQFELTVRGKVQIHLIFKQHFQAVETCKKFLIMLSEEEEVPLNLDLLRLFHLNVLAAFADLDQAELYEKEIIEKLKTFKDKLGQDELISLMKYNNITAEKYKTVLGVSF